MTPVTFTDASPPFIERWVLCPFLEWAVAPKVEFEQQLQSFETRCTELLPLATEQRASRRAVLEAQLAADPDEEDVFELLHELEQLEGEYSITKLAFAEACSAHPSPLTPLTFMSPPGNRPLPARSSLERLCSNSKLAQRLFSFTPLYSCAGLSLKTLPCIVRGSPPDLSDDARRYMAHLEDERESIECVVDHCTLAGLLAVDWSARAWEAPSSLALPFVGPLALPEGRWHPAPDVNASRRELMGDGMAVLTEFAAAVRDGGGEPDEMRFLIGWAG
jgi:hypothetical protein